MHTRRCAHKRTSAFAASRADVSSSTLDRYCRSTFRNLACAASFSSSARSFAASRACSSSVAASRASCSPLSASLRSPSSTRRPSRILASCTLPRDSAAAGSFTIAVLCWRSDQLPHL